MFARQAPALPGREAGRDVVACRSHPIAAKFVHTPCSGYAATFPPASEIWSPRHTQPYRTNANQPTALFKCCGAVDRGTPRKISSSIKRARVCRPASQRVSFVVQQYWTLARRRVGGQAQNSRSYDPAVAVFMALRFNGVFSGESHRGLSHQWLTNAVHCFHSLPAQFVECTAAPKRQTAARWRLRT